MISFELLFELESDSVQIRKEIASYIMFALWFTDPHDMILV